MNVYEATQERLDRIFADFDNVYVSFSGGKDSGVLLNLCLDYIKSHNLNIRLGVFHIDYEAQYDATTQYVNETLAQHADKVDIYRCCVPFKVSTCTSVYQNYWRPWEKSKEDLWVSPMPENRYTEKDFPFYTDKIWDYHFQERFALWLHEKKRAKRTCCLVGIRTQESLHRWWAIHSDRKFRDYCDLKWTKEMFTGVYNAYPIYDWITEDVWTANARFEWGYNRLYDLYYQAGVPLDAMRVASPFISAAVDSLKLYRVIEPHTWGKLVFRVNGVNFSSSYGKKWKAIRLPKGHTWRTYMYFLLDTLPERSRKNYLAKLNTSKRFWREKGGCLSEKTIRELIAAGVEIEVCDATNYRTSKRPVRMEYIDDIDCSDFQYIPTYKRMCICILRNDHQCKYMGFTLTKAETDRRKAALDQYNLL
jgi:predicted phosphoadenosine phosphosulfate sulfurtransferase